MEAVSLALGVIPILMASASYYKRAYRSYRIISSQTFRERHKEEFHSHLEHELALFQLILRNALSDLNDVERIALANANHNTWPANTKKALELKLGPATNSFVECLQEALGVLDDLLSGKVKQSFKDDVVQGKYHSVNTKLHLIRNSTKWKDEGFVKRVLYTSQKGKQRKCLEKFRCLVSKLERMSGLAGAFPSELEAAPVDQAKLASRPRQLVHEAYDAISGIWACNCAPRHEFKLCTNMCCDEFDDPAIVTLDTYISTSTIGPESFWYEGNLVLGSHFTRVNQPLPVRFATEATGKRQRRSSASLVSRENADSVCTLIEKALQQGTVLELMYDGGQPRPNLFHIPAWVHGRGRTRNTHTVVTLHDHFKERTRLSLKNKCILAVVLAKSFLNFTESKWIKNWNKESISFITTSTGTIDYRRPCLTTDFSSSTTTTEGINVSQFEDKQLHPCIPLLQLAIMLLELHLEDTIENRRTTADFVDGRVCGNTDLWTAERLLEENVDDIQVDYKRAVSACLRCQYDVATTFGSEVFCNLFHTTVVAPLERELYHGFEITTDDLRI